MVLVKIWPFFQPSFYSLLVRKMLFTIFQNEKTPSQATKLTFFQIGLFMVLLQMWPFSNFFLQPTLVRKMLFTILQNEKTPFQATKTGSSKSRRFDIFPKGLIHGFSPNVAIFPTFFLQGIEVRKMSLTIFQNEKTPLQAIKTRSSRSRKIDIFPKGLSHGFGPNVAMFPAFFQALIVEKMPFTIFQNDKAPFQAVKTRSS